MKLKDDTVLIVGAITIAIYIIYKKFDEFRERTGEGIAAWWASLTFPDPVRVNAQVRLPNGLLVNATELHITKTTGRDQYTFMYMDRRYEVLPRDGSGIYGSRLVAV